MLVLLSVALWFILRGDLFYVLPCVILFLCFSVLLALRLPRLGKRVLILVFFVRLFDLCLFGFVSFLFLFVSGKGSVCDCGTPWTFLLPFFLMGSSSSSLLQKYSIDLYVLALGSKSHTSSSIHVLNIQRSGIYTYLTEHQRIIHIGYCLVKRQPAMLMTLFS